jgi:cation:H+ antiporter
VASVIALWVLAAVAGLSLSAIASSRSVDHAAKAAAGLGIPPFIVGFTLIAIGTDLPEIANSVAASLAGHGDINVGDSIGSAAAQGTLVIGLIPFAARRMSLSRHNVGQLGGLAVGALLLGVLLTADGQLSRLDGIVLVLGWVVAIIFAWRTTTRPKQPALPLPEAHGGRHGLAAGAYLGAVLAGAALAVLALTRAAELLGIPEYLVSFIGLALGTSLPELAIAVTAARQGMGDLALGDVLGATLADASLSMGIGPLVAPTAVTAALAIRGGLVTAAIVAAATLTLVIAGRHNRWTGAVIVLLYLVAIPVVVSAA